MDPTPLNPKHIDLKEFRAKLSERVAARVLEKNECSGGRAAAEAAGTLAAPSRPQGGPKYWRSLDELADTPEFRELMHREFPKAASEWDDEQSRRNFLKLMGASLALAGVGTALTGCDVGQHLDQEKIVPYVQQPEQLVPGRPLYYASTMPHGGFGYGVLVEQHEGRPTKVEGNPDHPASLGATNVWMQASPLTLYDPDRSQVPLWNGNVSTWGTFFDQLRTRFAAHSGAAAPLRVRILTETVTSPTLADLIQRLMRTVPGVQWHAFDPVARDNIRQGAQQAFGADLVPVYHFDKAKVVLSIDSGLFLEDPGALPYARAFISGRRRPESAQEMNRLYAIESTPTIVGAYADNRKRLSPAGVQAAARRLAALLTGQAGGASAETYGLEPAKAQEVEAFLQAVAGDLKSHNGAAVVVAGEWQPPEIHALVYAMNAALGSIGDGKPLMFIKPPEASPAGGTQSLRELVSAMDAGQVDMLLILGGNPAYTAPADIPFAAALERYTKALHQGQLGFAAHLSLYNDETSQRCQWHLPESHYLEAWGDVRAFDGTPSLIQPLIAPLYQGRTAIELAGAMIDRWQSVLSPPSTQPSSQPSGAEPGAGGAAQTQPSENAFEFTGVLNALSGFGLIRSYWRRQLGDMGFETRWQKALMSGVIGKAFASEAVTAGGGGSGAGAGASAQPAPTGAITVIFRPDPSIWDGRYANNGWLQELPKPLTKLTWDNALLISPATAVALNLGAGELTDMEGNQDKRQVNLLQIAGHFVTLKAGDRTLEHVPVWLMPGHPDHCGTLYLGYGREFGGRVAVSGEANDPRGVNANVLRLSTSPWSIAGVEVHVEPGRKALASTQMHQLIDTEANDWRGLVRHGTSVDEIAEHFEQKEAPENRRDHALSLPILPDAPNRSPKSLYPGAPDQGTPDGSHNPLYPAWAMSIDLTACVGCNACVMACQAENNIPVVGKESVMRQRYMHWLRIDTYYLGDTGDDPDVFFQPLPCMHCEKAPCEVVCPVEATQHDVEGLNVMTYNRCVGTRYCQNNCPYKVRRFNFFQYQDRDTPVLQLLHNPDVTVRNRGVMEKCTYCIQRISHGRIEAKKVEVQTAEARTPAEAQKKVEEARRILDSVTTACAQACPTEAIVFGNWADAKSKIYALKQLKADYGLLDEELQTKPRTTYLYRLQNPNENIPSAHPGKHPEMHGNPHYPPTQPALPEKHQAEPQASAAGRA